MPSTPSVPPPAASPSPAEAPVVVRQAVLLLRLAALVVVVLAVLEVAGVDVLPEGVVSGLRLSGTAVGGIFAAAGLATLWLSIAVRQGVGWARLVVLGLIALDWVVLYLTMDQLSPVGVVAGVVRLGLEIPAAALLLGARGRAWFGAPAPDADARD